MKTKKSKQGSDSREAILKELADKSGLAVVLSSEPGLSTLAEANNNSVCENLSKSKKFAPQCQRFCGSAFKTATESGKAVKYKCHAGLECIAVPLKSKGRNDLVAIAGRAFTMGSDYKDATRKAVEGEWKGFPPTKFFENILMTGSTENITKFGQKLNQLSEDEIDALYGPEAGIKAAAKSADLLEIKRPAADPKSEANSAGDPAPKVAIVSSASTEPTHEEITAGKADKAGQTPRKDTAIPRIPTEQDQEDAEEFIAWGTFFRSIHDMDYDGACFSILQFISTRYGISSLAWLENVNNSLKKVLAIGALKKQAIGISIPTNDARLLGVFRRHSSIELRQRNGNSKKSDENTIRLFPVAIRDEIRSALVLGEKSKDKRVVRHVSRFCHVIASELEIIRLRQALLKKSWLDNAFAKFNNNLTLVDTNHFWMSIMKTAADLVKAGRGSLLVYDEKAKSLVVRAAIGKKAEFIENSEGEIGKRIAKNVWKNGKPLVVADINKIGLPPAPPDWEYSSGSFISYPISIGKRRIGVLNVTDKTDGGIFDKSDLTLLKSIAPQLAVTIDRALLKSKAGEFEQLSVTDPLTGLLNRRYLEERLTEEIKRSDRHGYPMSFLMIDVDHFKSYNDSFTHPEGDKALQIVGQCIRESLRDADVAARYGGEEFSILLPQTNLDEARTIAERIRETISMTEFPNRQVTVSIGVTGASSSRDTAEEIISSADKALFEAKREGRNNVQIFEYVRKNLKIGS